MLGIYKKYKEYKELSFVEKYKFKEDVCAKILKFFFIIFLIPTLYYIYYAFGTGVLFIFLFLLFSHKL